MRFAIVTFGCRVNQADSLHIEEDLRRRGGEPSSAATADVVIVNTCSVTASADQGARQVVRRIARENPSARIVATGCYATRRPEDLESLPNVVRVVRNDDKLSIGGLPGLTTAARFGGGDGPCGAPLEPGIAGRTAFTLRVQTGCDQACAYCIIPATRGRSRSRPLEEIVAEARRVASAGFREIALTGVHLGSYGRDLSPASSLLDLLRALQRAELDVTFRISSLEPMDCVPGIVDLVAESGGAFAPHFHLPLQHASDAMLARMRRPYALAGYRALVDGIIDRLPHASIGTDMIAGFPGETDEEFAENLAHLPMLPLSHVHVFPYSDRPGTEASAIPSKVPGPVIRERGVRLREIGTRMTERFRDRQVGTIRPALTLDDGTTALTDNYLKLKIPEGWSRNEAIRVRVLDHHTAVPVGA